MTHTCKNCGNHAKGNFCHFCGQRTKVERLSFKNLLADAGYGLFHFSNKTWFTIKELFRHPGAVAKEYIAGKRVKYAEPVTFVLVLTALILGCTEILNHTIDFLHEQKGWFFLEKDAPMPQGLQWFEKIKHGHWLGSLWGAFALLPAAFASWLVFKKSGYNFIEHVVLTAFLSGQRMIIHFCIIFPSTLIVRSLDEGSIKNRFTLSFILMEIVLFLVFVVMAYRQFFSQFKRPVIVAKTLFFAVLALVFSISVNLIFFMLLAASRALIYNHSFALELEELFK